MVAAHESGRPDYTNVRSMLATGFKVVPWIAPATPGVVSGVGILVRVPALDALMEGAGTVLGGEVHVPVAIVLKSRAQVDALIALLTSARENAFPLAPQAPT